MWVMRAALPGAARFFARQVDSIGRVKKASLTSIARWRTCLSASIIHFGIGEERLQYYYHLYFYIN
jgi:hypothetical protein